MKHTDLPSPGLINKAGELRLTMAQSISYVQTMAKYQANGKSKHATTLAAFLTAAQTAVALLVDSVLPTYSSSSITGSTLTMLYSEQLKATLTLPSAFTVTVAAVGRTVTGVLVTGNTVVLTLATPVTSGQAVTVAYAVPTPADEKLQDPSGNFAAARTSTAVTNLTP